MRKIDNMNDTTDVNEEKRESPFYSFFDADLVFDIIEMLKPPAMLGRIE